MFELKDFSVTYAGCPDWILQDIHLCREVPGCLGLIGENGSGKTTLAAALTGVIPEYINGSIRGIVSLDGENLSLLPLSRRLEKVAYVLQDFESQILFGNVENILGLNEKNTCKDILYKAIELLKIEHLLQCSPSSLSSGELQRIVLAASLRGNPALLIYDEVTSVLDPLLKRKLQEYIAWLSEMGKYILLMGQRSSLLSLYTNRIYRIKNHSIVPDGPEEECSINVDWSLLEKQKPGTESSGNLLLEKLLLVRKNNENSFCLNIEGMVLPRGETIAVLGAYGSGKTTFFNLLYGLIKPDYCRIVWGTKKYEGSRLKELGNSIDYVMHNPYHGITCNTVLGELNSTATDETCIHHIFKLFPFLLPEIDPYNLSFGQLRMLSFLQSILRDKPLLCLDEPEYGLDNKNYALVQQYLQYNCNEKVKTILFSTHDLELAKRCSNRVILFKAGRICAMEKTEDISDLYSWFISYYED